MTTGVQLFLVEENIDYWIWSSPKFERQSTPSDLFLRKGVLKIYSKFTGEHPCPSVISIIAFWHDVLLQICCIFSEHFFLTTQLGSCFWNWTRELVNILKANCNVNCFYWPIQCWSLKKKNEVIFSKRLLFELCQKA